jgi:hypothetical protein
LHFSVFRNAVRVTHEWTVFHVHDADQPADRLARERSRRTR